MKIRLILKEILPFYFRLVVLAVVTLFIDLILHLTDLVWIGRYLGIPGVILILLSFGHSLRKRGVIKSSNPVRLLRLHEWLAWIGATLVLVHAGIHFNAILAWLAVAAMAVNITSGLTGKYLVQRSQRWMKQAKTELRDEGLTDSEIDQQLFWNSLAAGLVRKWRTIHLPIALAFAVLAAAHILSTFLFWGWK
ncbi:MULTISPECIES: hypothetical protein [Sphingomonadaceae]|uniref:Ferric reductase like protein n=1 Tax=Sphingobium wenxiniae (strain DSM 21828 / CGMCC 1.7748 / JZ-1) TaxID=595605 RepID=A0A562K1W6_SPHWJ|nr:MULTISPECIES: hypothetical protein [Sphingomonadaceae]MBB6193659.1 hypothetical protein [Sphingobium wenxiniae]TWH89421.1 hypothetical protein IQ35_03858 [Sphingobium wenxiniae]